ncbi:unnamed protein product [Arabidopsis lyrata]|nr:unnamed protein product [Arabidopsis lyrata]
MMKTSPRRTCATGSGSGVPRRLGSGVPRRLGSSTSETTKLGYLRDDWARVPRSNWLGFPRGNWTRVLETSCSGIPEAMCSGLLNRLGGMESDPNSFFRTVSSSEKMSVTAGVNDTIIAVREKLRGKVGQTKVKRYWPGKAPEWAEEDKEEDVTMHKVVVLDKKDDPRLRRLAKTRTENRRAGKIRRTSSTQDQAMKSLQEILNTIQKGMKLVCMCLPLAKKRTMIKTTSSGKVENPKRMYTSVTMLLVLQFPSTKWALSEGGITSCLRTAPDLTRLRLIASLALFNAAAAVVWRCFMRLHLSFEVQPAEVWARRASLSCSGGLWRKVVRMMRRPHWLGVGVTGPF